MTTTFVVDRSDFRRTRWVDTPADAATGCIPVGGFATVTERAERQRGREAVEQVCAQLLDGRVDPQAGHLLAL